MEASGSFSYVFLLNSLRKSIGKPLEASGSFSYVFRLISARKSIGNALVDFIEEINRKRPWRPQAQSGPSPITWSRTDSASRNAEIVFPQGA